MVDPLAQMPIDGVRKAYMSLNPSSTDAQFEAWWKNLEGADDYDEQMFATFADLCNACLTAFSREGEPSLSETDIHQIAYAEGHYDTKRRLLQKLAQH